MDERQFAQRLLALLNRNPNINLAEYFRNEPAFQEFIRITQFRHYRADEPQQQLLKLLIPALIESVAMEVPGLIATKELFVPALIQKTQAEYGAIAVLFAKFRFVTEFPTELCRCVRYQPLANGCAPICNGDGVFETPEECADFRNNASGGVVNRYYATAQNSAWMGFQSTNSLTEVAPSANLFVLKFGSTPMIRQENLLVGGTYVSRWVGQGGGYYEEKDLDLYYVGAEFWRPGGVVQLELTGYNYSSPNGISFNFSDFKSVQGSYPQDPIQIFGLQGCMTFIIPDNRISQVSRPRGVLQGFANVPFTASPPVFPAAPTPVYPNNEGKYTILQLYLGGDRETPLLLGEFLLRRSLGLSDTAFLFDRLVPSQDDQSYIYQKWLADADYFLPEWASTETAGDGFTYIKAPSTDDNKKAIVALFTWTNTDGFNPENFQSYIVKLSETESEICIKYQTFKQVKRIAQVGSSSYVEYKVIWCEIIIMKVSGGSVSRRTYNYPEAVSVDPRNWAAAWCKNWVKSEDDYSPSSTGTVEFFTKENINTLFNNVEPAIYLDAHLKGIRGSWRNQSPEAVLFPANSKSTCLKGVNFTTIDNKLYALDAKLNQSFKINRNDKEYTVLMPEAIKHQTTEVFVRFGEVERLDYENFYYTNDGKLTNYYYRFDNYRIWQLKGTPRAVKAKVFKIPSDSIILEISANLEPSKFEASSLIIKPQIYQSPFSYYYENIILIKVADVTFLDSNSRLNPETSEQNFNYNVSPFNASWLFGTGVTPYTLIGCGNQNYTFPSPYETYRPSFLDPIIKGYCENG